MGSEMESVWSLVLLWSVFVVASASFEGVDTVVPESKPQDYSQETSKPARHAFDLGDQMARDGIVFVGDSPARRMYVRSIVHLERINDETLAENMQNDAKMLNHEQLEQ